MLVVWEITREDAARLDLAHTEAVALAGEWAMEWLQPYCSFYRSTAIAGGQRKLDEMFAKIAHENSDFRREVRIRLLIALELCFYVPNVS